MSDFHFIRDSRGNPTGRIHEDDDDCRTFQDNHGNTEFRIVRRADGTKVVLDRQGNVVEYIDD